MSQRSNLQLENQVLRAEAAEYETALGEAAVVIDDLTAALYADKAEIRALKAQIAELEAALPKPKKPRPARVVPPDELERLNRMAAAKAHAMASGQTVLAA